MKNRFGDYIVYIKIVPGLVDGVGGWVKLIMAKPAFSLQLLKLSEIVFYEENLTLHCLFLCNLFGHAMSPHQLLERPHVGTTAMQCSENGFNYSLTHSLSDKVTY